MTYEEDNAMQVKYKVHVERNIWIIKPGENSNQGVGIHVTDSLNEINQMVRSSS
jgi:hypothetical protein